MQPACCSPEPTSVTRPPPHVRPAPQPRQPTPPTLWWSSSSRQLCLPRSPTPDCSPASPQFCLNPRIQTCLRVRIQPSHRPNPRLQPVRPSASQLSPRTLTRPSAAPSRVPSWPPTPPTSTLCPSSSSPPPAPSTPPPSTPQTPSPPPSSPPPSPLALTAP